MFLAHFFTFDHIFFFTYIADNSCFLNIFHESTNIILAILKNKEINKKEYSLHETNTTK